MVAAAVHEIAPGVTRVFEPAEVRELEGLIAELGRIDGRVGGRALDDDAVRVDQIDLLERLKSAAEAAQSRVIDPQPGHHVIEVTTPTGHSYLSRPPSALGP